MKLWFRSKRLRGVTPGGGHSGREKRRRKFLRMKHRAPRMLLKRTSSTTHSNARFWLGTIGGQHLSFRDLLIPRSLPATSTVRRTCLARAGKLSSRRVLKEKGYRSDWPLLGLRRWELLGLNQPRPQVLSPTLLSLSRSVGTGRREH